MFHRTKDRMITSHSLSTVDIVKWIHKVSLPTQNTSPPRTVQQKTISLTTPVRQFSHHIPIPTPTVQAITLPPNPKLP